MDDKTMNQLAAYVAGTLNGSSRQDIEARLNSDAELRSQLECLRLVAGGLRDYLPTPPRDVGVEMAMQRIRQQATSPGRPSLWDRLRGFFPGWLLTPRALALTGIAVIAAQLALIGHLVLDQERAYSELRAGTTRPPSSGPFIKVSFRPESAEKDLRFLLVSVGATIVGGPTQLGDYYVYLEAGRIDWAAQQLRQSQIVDAVSVIATLPALKE